MFVYDQPMDGHGHLTKKVQCPKCKYHLFNLILTNECSTLKAQCRSCGFTTDGIGGIQYQLEEIIRDVIQIHNGEST